MEHSLDTIAQYAGTWKTTIAYRATPFSKEHRESKTLENDCWRSGEFYACHQIVDGTSAALLVFTYDAASDTFYSHPVAPGDAPSPAGVLKISGDEWTFPWQQKDGATVTYFRVRNIFHGSDRIEFHQEYSTDDLHWNAIADGDERKIAP